MAAMEAILDTYAQPPRSCHPAGVFRRNRQGAPARRPDGPDRHGDRITSASAAAAPSVPGLCACPRLATGASRRSAPPSTGRWRCANWSTSTSPPPSGSLPCSIISPTRRQLILYPPSGSRAASPRGRLSATFPAGRGWRLAGVVRSVWRGTPRPGRRWSPRPLHGCAAPRRPPAGAARAHLSAPPLPDLDMRHFNVDSLLHDTGSRHRPCGSTVPSTRLAQMSSEPNTAQRLSF